MRNIRWGAALMLMLALCIPALAQGEVADGVFTGSGEGRNGAISVEVTFEGGAIQSVVIGENKETETIAQPVFDKVPQEIVERQSIAVDAMAGATMTLNGVIDGVKHCIEQAGGNPADFEKAAETALSTEVRNVETDVLVIGAGASGMSAAIQAQESGVEHVMLTEKNDSPAGSASNLAVTMMGINSAYQSSLGIGPDSLNPEHTSWEELKTELLNYWVRQMSWKVNARIIRNYIDLSGDTVDWLIAHGFEYMKVEPQMTSNHWYHENVNGTHWLGKGKYAGFATAALDNFAAQGGEVLYNTTATELIQNESGDVIGAKAVQKDGTTLVISAKAVILCTGGFGSNRDWVINKVGYTGPLEGAPNAGDGSGMLMAYEAGAQAYNEDLILIHHLYSTPADTDLSDFGNKMNAILNYIQSFVHLNPNGTRFRNEFDIECGVAAAEGAVAQGYYWNVFTQDKVDTLINEGIQGLNMNSMHVPLSFGYHPTPDEKWTELPIVLERMEANGVMVKADTLEELAEKTGMNYDILADNLADYNAACEAGVDLLYQKDAKYLLPMQEGPYYAMKVVTRYLTSLGGLKINENMQILDENEQAIEGLYAAGVDAAGVLYGDAYVDIDGAGFGWAFNSGRMAAMEAARKLSE